MQQMVLDVTGHPFPEFMRRAEPTFAGLGLSVPARVPGNVWLLNDALRGRIAEMVHGRDLPFTFPTIDKFVNGIATSIKSVERGRWKFVISASTVPTRSGGWTNSEVQRLPARGIPSGDTRAASSSARSAVVPTATMRPPPARVRAMDSAAAVDIE